MCSTKELKEMVNDQFGFQSYAAQVGNIGEMAAASAWRVHSRGALYLT